MTKLTVKLEETFSDRQLLRIVDLAIRRMKDNGVTEYDKADQKIFFKMVKEITSKRGLYLK